MLEGPIRVLLIEDNPPDAYFIRAMLADSKKGSFRVEWVDRLSKGLEKLDDGGFDAVLLDLSLPDSRGFETFATVHSRFPLLPIVPMTGLDDEEMAARAVRSGAQDYLVKGDVNPNLLASALRYAIERKKAEEALRESERRYRVLFESTGTATVVLDEDMTISLANAGFEKLSGYSKEEIQGAVRLDEFLEAVEGQTPAYFAADSDTHEEASPCTDELKFIDRNGEVRWVFMTTASVPGSRGRVASLLDITERKHVEEQLQRIKKIESVGMLAGGIAHDFNNILTAILGNISLARLYAQGNEKVVKRLAEAEKGSYRAQDLAGQLLTFAKGGAPVKKISSIADLVKGTAAFALAGSNLQCRFSADDSVWPVEVDEGQISQVINNLIVNAQHAMPTGGFIDVVVENVTLDTREGAESLRLPEGRYVKITVRDHGGGIPSENLTKIFDPYFTTKPKGSGLGLAIAFSVVEKHDGRITVESTEGNGAAFFVYLRASEHGTPQQQSVPPPAVRGEGKILVMDDEEIVRSLACEMLAELGYDGDFACEGGEAIDLYKKAKEDGTPYDVVIMDLTIRGGMGGKEAIARLRGFDPDVKAIVSSGYANDPIMANYKEHGFVGVVPKPYRIQELSRTIRQVISGVG